MQLCIITTMFPSLAWFSDEWRSVTEVPWRLCQWLFMDTQDSAILRYYARSNVFSWYSFTPSHLITHVVFPKQLVDSDRNNPVTRRVSVISVQTCWKVSHTFPCLSCSSLSCCLVEGNHLSVFLPRVTEVVVAIDQASSSFIRSKFL